MSRPADELPEALVAGIRQMLGLLDRMGLQLDEDIAVVLRAHVADVIRRDPLDRDAAIVGAVADVISRQRDQAPETARKAVKRAAARPGSYERDHRRLELHIDCGEY